MPCMHKSREINYSKPKVITDRMKSVIVNPRNEKEFELAFSLMKEFSKDQKSLSLDEGDHIGFAFLMNKTQQVKETPVKVITKKK